ncbi:MAG: YDG domain-containing protein, partial [Prevotellaceae bacterium]|nr:YDG domain-containing protein [Prevotellaceae bacterium]
MSSTLRKSSILSGIIFLLSVGSLQAADDPTWIVGSDTVWESGSGGGPVNLSAYRFYGSMSILDSLEALQDDGTITYRTLHGWDDYEGLSVSPDTTLTIPNRPAAPVRDSDYIFNFRDEKITIQDKTYKCDTMQFMQVGGTPVWTNIETQQSNGKNNWTFEEAGWNPGWMERRFRVRFGYRAMANYEEDPNNNFASSYRIDVIPARPAEPENFCIRIVSDGGGTDTTFISHSDSASYYELRADTVDVDTWTSLHKDCSGSADVSPCWSTYPASLDTTYHLRYAATDSLPASLSVVISNRLNIVRSIIFPSYAYGTEVDESKRKKIEIFNYSENDTIYANLKLKKGSSSPFVLTTHPHRDSTTVVRPRDESECFVRNDTNTIIPKNGLSSGLYTDSLVVTYADGAVQYIAVVLEVARIPWNMSGISGRIISSTENMLVLYVTNAQALSGAMLSYYLGSTFAGQGSDTVQFYGELTYLFYNLTPATAYPVSVKPLGNSNHLEPEQPTMLVTGYTAYATPVFDQTVAVNYLQEQLEFINSAQGSDYTVTAAAGTDTGTVLPPYSLTSYLDSLSQSTFRVRLVHRAGVNPPIPASAPGISSSITGRAPAPALDSITTVNTSGATIDGKIYLRGDFQYRVHSSIGGSGGGSWTTASDSVTIGSGWYDIRRPANSNTFASHYIPVKVGGQCIVTFNSNGGNPSTSQATVKEDAPMGGLPSSISNPTRLGHEFVAWYTTQELTTEWDLATDTVKQDTTLFAKWEVKKEVLTICAAKAMQNITYGQDDSICFTPYADNSTPLPAGCTLSGSLVLNGAAKSSSGHYKVGRYGFDTIMVVLLYNNNKDTVNQHFTISMKADSVSISKKVLELMNVVVNSKVYNDSASAGNPPFTGTQPSLVPGYVVSGDTVALVNGAPVFGNKNVGNQIPITFDPPFTLTGKDSGNYDLPQPTGIAANITRATLTVTPTSGLYKIYDPQQSDPPLTYKASGWKGDDSISSPLKDSLSRTAGEDVGTFRIGLGNLKDTSGNYTISFVDSVLFHIKKATPDKKHFTYAPPQDTVYSGAAKTAIVSMKSPYTLGSAVNLTVKYYQGDSEKNPISVGTYTVKVFVPEGAGNLTHNEIGIEVGSFSIIKKKISVTGGAVMEKAYDGTDTAAVAASGL